MPVLFYVCICNKNGRESPFVCEFQLNVLNFLLTSLLSSQFTLFQFLFRLSLWNRKKFAWIPLDHKMTECQSITKCNKMHFSPIRSRIRNSYVFASFEAINFNCGFVQFVFCLNVTEIEMLVEVCAAIRSWHNYIMKIQFQTYRYTQYSAQGKRIPILS